MPFYFPDGLLDDFVVDYQRAGGLPRDPDEPDLTGRGELVAYRNAKTVYEHRYRSHRIIARVYDEPTRASRFSGVADALDAWVRARVRLSRA